MSSLTIELPEVLVQRMEKSGMNPDQMESLFIQFVNDYLTERERQVASTGVPERASVVFGREFIHDNLELFLELAKR